MQSDAYEAWHLQMASAELQAEATLYPWHETVLKLLPDLSGKRVLELGCGRGDFSLLLARKYPSAMITAVDFADAAINEARRKAEQERSAAAFEVGNATCLRFGDDSFDHVISCECLEHISQPHRMASEVFRVLASGGQFVITTENYFNGLLLAWLMSWLRGMPFESGSGVQPHENFFFILASQTTPSGSGPLC